MEEDVAHEAEQERRHLLPVEHSSPQGKHDGQEKEREQDQFQQRGELAPPEIDQALGDLVSDGGGEGPDPQLRLLTSRQERVGCGCLRQPLYLHVVLLLLRAGVRVNQREMRVCMSYRNVPCRITRRSFSRNTSQPRTKSPAVWMRSHGSVPSAQMERNA